MPPDQNIQVTFVYPNGDEKTIHAKQNQSVMQAALDHTINGIDGICGGCIACATCHIHIPPAWQSRVENEDNEQSEEETDMLDMAENRTENSRLGCQIKLTRTLNGITIHLP